MAIALTVKTALGESLGTCCRKCYDAVPTTKCICICGGKNHGVGRVLAMSQSRAIAATLGNAEAHPESNQMLLGCMVDE